MNHEEVDMPIKKLKEYLDNMNVKYATINHPVAYTSQQIASVTHIKGKELAKTVMVKIDGKMAMVVLPASYKVDLDLVKIATGANIISLATEAEFQNMFSDCEAGAMPPFGNLYGIDVYAEEKLAEDEEIVFNACSHRELIKLEYKDFKRLVKPKMGRYITGKVPAF
jgi:Ala-tRNA(Pro) deacylase